MKYLILFSSILMGMVSCKSVNKQIAEEIAGADSVAINYFRGDGTIDTVTSVKIISDKNKMEQLTHFIASTSAEANVLCGYDGSIHFFKMDKVIRDIDFRMNDANCMIFSFVQEGKITATALSTEAKLFLENIKK